MSSKVQGIMKSMYIGRRIIQAEIRSKKQNKYIFLSYSYNLGYCRTYDERDGFFKP